jgi:hypothetical protein
MTERTKAIGACAVSAALLIVGFYVLLWDVGDPALQKAATGWIGFVAGFWLK